MRLPVLVSDEGVLPSAGYGLGLGAGVRVGQMLIMLSGVVWLSQNEAGASPYAATYQRRTGELSGCYSWQYGQFEGGPCLMTTFEDVTADGSGGAVVDRQGRVSWLTLGFGARAGLDHHPVGRPRSSPDCEPHHVAAYLCHRRCRARLQGSPRRGRSQVGPSGFFDGFACAMTLPSSMTPMTATAGPRLEAEARAGETAAVLPSFRWIYDAYFDFVWSSTRRLGVPVDAVDDVVQETSSW